MPKAVTVVATIVVHPEHRSDVADALQRAVAATWRESGCEQYALHLDRNDENCFVLIERWRDMASIDVHAKGPAFTELATVLQGRATLQVTFYDAVA